MPLLKPMLPVDFTFGKEQNNLITVRSAARFRCGNNSWPEKILREHFFIIVNKVCLLPRLCPHESHSMNASMTIYKA